MLPPAPADEPAPVDPLSELIGLEGWPHLRFGFAVEQGTAPDGLQLVVAMSFDVPPSPPQSVAGAESPGALPAALDPVPQKPDEAGSNHDPVAADLERYREICRQWEAEVEVTLEASFCVGSVPPVGALSPGVILRQNALTILGTLGEPDGPESGPSIELARLAFALPDPGASPESYPIKLLQPLAVALRFRRGAGGKPDTDDPGLDEGEACPVKPTDDDKPAEAAIEPAAPVAVVIAPEAVPVVPAAPRPSTVTPVPPQADAGALPRTHAHFATRFEAAYASLGWRVMADDPGAAGGAGFFLLGWQVKDGLQFSLKEPVAPAAAGFACPLISPVAYTRADISGALLPATFPARFARTERWSVQDFDLDAELGRFLGEVEEFLAPERRGLAAAVAPTLVERCVAAKERLAGLLGERVVPLGPTEPGSPAGKAAQAAMREACRDDLRNFHRIGAVAVLQLDLAAPQPLVVHGRFVPDAAPSPDVLAGASRLAATANGLAFPILAGAGDRGNDVRLPGVFRCEAIETLGAPLTADGQAGRRLHFVGDGDTRVPAPPLCTRLPVRARPRPPELRRQTFSTLEGDSVAAAKSWQLECEYGCDALAQDTLRLGVAFPRPAGEPAAPRPGPVPAPSPDLLDALVIFRTIFPAVAAAFDRGLRPAAGASASGPDAATAEAIRAFVMLVEEVAQHFNPPPAEPAGGLEGGEERRDLTRPPAGPIVAGPFDLTLRSQARCALQVVRNLTTGLPPAFHYPTRVVRPAEAVHAFVDRELELDLATLPLLEHYMPDGPARGSLLDCLTRLLRAVIAAPAPAEEAPPLSVSLRVEFAARLAGSGDDGPTVRLPVVIVRPKTISGARRLLEMRAWARPVADQLEAWLAHNDPRTGGGYERTGARFVFELTLDAAENAPGAGGRPRWLRWRGLYFRCTDAG